MTACRHSIVNTLSGQCQGCDQLVHPSVHDRVTLLEDSIHPLVARIGALEARKLDLGVVEARRILLVEQIAKWVEENGWDRDEHNELLYGDYVEINGNEYREHVPSPAKLAAAIRKIFGSADVSDQRPTPEASGTPQNPGASGEEAKTDGVTTNGFMYLFGWLKGSQGHILGVEVTESHADLGEPSDGTDVVLNPYFCTSKERLDDATIDSWAHMSYEHQLTNTVIPIRHLCAPVPTVRIVRAAEES